MHNVARDLSESKAQDAGAAVALDKLAQGWLYGAAWRCGIVASPSFTGAVSHVLHMLEFHMPAGSPQAWPSQALLSEETGHHLRTVRRALLRVERLGWLRIERTGARVVNTYHAHVPGAPTWQDWREAGGHRIRKSAADPLDPFAGWEGMRPSLEGMTPSLMGHDALRNGQVNGHRNGLLYKSAAAKPSAFTSPGTGQEAGGPRC